MFQTNPKVDPLVEVLRLAYRRGLAIRQEQEQSKKQPVSTELETVDNKPKNQAIGEGRNLK